MVTCGAETASQQCHGDHLAACELLAEPQLWKHQASGVAAGPHTLRGAAEVTVSSVHRERFAACPEITQVETLARDFLHTYSYGYRRHRRDGAGRLLAHLQPGSCLDAAVCFQDVCTSAGLAVTLIGGIIAHNSLANPHFWLEVETAAGPMPVDITIPAIARMLGYDWSGG